MKDKKIEKTVIQQIIVKYRFVIMTDDSFEEKACQQTLVVLSCWSFFCGFLFWFFIFFFYNYKNLY